MSTKQTFIDATARLIMDTARELPQETHIDKAIDDAVIFFSRQIPRTRIYDITSGDGSTYDFATPTGFSGTDGVSRIVQVEYPTGNRPATILDPKDYTIYRQTSTTYKFRLLRHTPQSGVTTPSETVRILYATPHTVDSTTSTIPTEYEPAVEYKAAELACMMMAVQHNRSSDSLVEADTIDHGTRSQQWLELAKAFRGKYEDAIGTGDDRKVQAGFVVIERDTRMPWGEGKLTHDEDWF